MRIAIILIGLLASVSHATTIARDPLTHHECGTRQRSLVSDKSLQLEFSNLTKGTVTIYWLDFEGKRVRYNALAPGEAYSQQTYVTHPWVILDAKGRCLDQLVAVEPGTFPVPIRKR